MVTRKGMKDINTRLENMDKHTFWKTYNDTYNKLVTDADICDEATVIVGNVKLTKSVPGRFSKLFGKQKQEEWKGCSNDPKLQFTVQSSNSIPFSTPKQVIESAAHLISSYNIRGIHF